MAGRSPQQLAFVTVLLDANGGYVAGKESVMDLSLTAATLASFRRKGLDAAVSFNVPKGRYQVREVAREAVHNLLATSNTPVAAQ